MTTLQDLVRMPIPDGLYPSIDTIITISSFWLTMSTFSTKVTPKEMSEELVTFLYNSGYKVVKLEDKDLQ